MKARLYERYVKEVVPVLKERRKYTNVHQVPRMEKIVVNMGVSASLEKSAVDDAAKDLAMITGRKPVICKSRHSVANFKLRKNQPIGCRVTLRRDAMYEFFDRMISAALAPCWRRDSALSISAPGPIANRHDSCPIAWHWISTAMRELQPGYWVRCSVPHPCRTRNTWVSAWATSTAGSATRI